MKMRNSDRKLLEKLTMYLKPDPPESLPDKKNLITKNGKYIIPNFSQVRIRLLKRPMDYT